MARKRYVICAECGRQFDLNKKGGYYLKERRRYLCNSCGWENNRKARNAQMAKNMAASAEAAARRKEEKRLAADEREARTGMRQTFGGMIMKYVFAGLFFISSLSFLPEGEVINFLVGVAIAAGLFAWGFVPYRNAKVNVSENGENGRSTPGGETWLCTSCGASTKGQCCEYCGSPRLG